MSRLGLRCAGVGMVLAACLITSGCITTCVSNMMRSRNAKEVGEKAVASFHQQLDAGQFAAIYNAADSDFKKASNQEQVLQLFAAVHKKLGAVKQASASEYNVNFNLTGTFARLTYATEFAEGKATEYFVWHVDGDKAWLYSYNINSNALITK